MRKARLVPTPWECRKTMISRTTFWSFHAETIFFCRPLPIPSTSSSWSGVCSMTSKTARREGLPTSRSASLGPMPLTMPLAEVLLHPLGGLGLGGLEHLGPELLAVGGVDGPAALGVDPLARPHFRQRAEDGHQITLALDLHPEDGEAAVGVVEGDPLDQPGKGFEGRSLGGLRHGRRFCAFSGHSGTRPSVADSARRGRAVTDWPLLACREKEAPFGVRPPIPRPHFY